MPPISIPITTSAAQSNRQIQIWFDEYQSDACGPHRKSDLRLAIERMYLQSINQVRARQSKPPTTMTHSWFAEHDTLNPHLAQARQRAAIQDRGIQPPTPDFSQPYPDPTIRQGRYILPRLPVNDVQTPSAPLKSADPVIVSPAVDDALAALSAPLPPSIQRWTQELDQAGAHLKNIFDRSSPEARKTRKQIRALKDKLGIPR